MEKVRFKDRFGREVEFTRKERKFQQRPGESFLTALVRTYYPAQHREHNKLRRMKNA